MNGLVVLGIVGIVALVAIVAIVFGRNFYLNWSMTRQSGVMHVTKGDSKTDENQETS